MDELSYKQRYKTLDILKAIAIFLVVFQHNNYCAIDLLEKESLGGYASYFLRAIISVNVPLFFFVSGAVLLNRPLDLKRHGIKTCKLAGLTILWAILTLILTPLLRGVPISSLSFKNTLIHVWNWDSTSLNHFWFLRQMVILYLLFPLIKSDFDNYRCNFYFFLGVAVLFSFGNYIISMGWNAVRIFFLNQPPYASEGRFFNQFDFLTPMNGFSITYFMLGGLLWEKRNNLDRKKYRKWAPAVLLCACLLYTLYGIAITHFAETIYDLTWSGHNSPFVAVAVLCLFIMSFGWEGRGFEWLRKCILLVGQNTMGIYFFHVIFGGDLALLYQQMPYYDLFPVNLIYAMSMILLSLLATILIRKIPYVGKLVAT